MRRIITLTLTLILEEGDGDWETSLARWIVSPQKAHPTNSREVRAKRLRRTDSGRPGLEDWRNSAFASFLICLICLCVFWPATRPSAALPRFRLIFFVNT
jgi:hypothetical protein